VVKIHQTRFISKRTCIKYIMYARNTGGCQGNLGKRPEGKREETTASTLFLNIPLMDVTFPGTNE
jgi:hypothetical protein